MQEDDHEMLREEVRKFLAGQDGMEVVGEAVDGAAAGAGSTAC